MEQDRINVHIDNVYIQVDNQINDKLDAILVALEALTITGEETMADLSVLTSEVTNNTDVVNSAVALIAGLADQIQAAATDPAAVQALADNLRANNQALASAVAANTPAAPPVEEPPVV